MAFEDARPARDSGEAYLRGRPDAALLIDWENIKSSLDSRGMRPSIAAIRDACEQHGRIVLARAYADWQQRWVRDDPRHLYSAGIEPVFVPTRRYDDDTDSPTVKNSVDVRLASDCVELIYTHPQIGVYILVSGDQDFMHVVNKLRPYGKRVVGLAVSWSASPRLAELVDHMILYDRDIEPAPADVASPLPPAPGAGAPARLSLAAQQIAGREQLALEPTEQVVQAVLRVLRQYREDGRAMNVSVLGIELQRVLDTQLYRMNVSGRLQRIVGELGRYGVVQVVHRGVDDWLYLPDEPVAEEREPSRSEPEPYRSRVTWDELPDAVQRLAVEAVAGLESDPRLDYLTFNRIADGLGAALAAAGLAEEHPPRDVANAMVAGSVLIRDEEMSWYDSFTGRTGTFWSLRLNPEHAPAAAAPPGLVPE